MIGLLILLLVIVIALYYYGISFDWLIKSGDDVGRMINGGARRDTSGSTLIKTAESFYPQLNSTRKITLHFTPWCGYCKRLKPTWEQVKKNLSKTGVIFEEINGDDVKVDYVKSYPTIFMLSENGSRLKYEGERTVSALTKWILSPNLDGL